jgi:Protein of unknown function (DUF2568)
MSALKRINLGLRVLMEIGIILGFAHWGYHNGNSKTAKILLAIGASAIGFGFWGLVDFHRFGKMSELLRLAQELCISGLAAIALYKSERHILGVMLAAISIVHHVMVYVLGGRLLKK